MSQASPGTQGTQGENSGIAPEKPEDQEGNRGLSRRSGIKRGPPTRVGVGTEPASGGGMALDIHIDDLQRIRDVRIGSAPIAPRMNGKSAALHLTHGRRILKWTVDGRAFKILIEGDMSEEKLNLTPKYPWVQVKGSLSVVWLHPISPASRPRSSRSRLEELPMVSDEFLNEQLNAVYRSQTNPSSWLSLR